MTSEQRSEPNDFPTQIRKCIRIGHSHAITLPAAWIRQYIDHTRPYLVVTTLPDGLLTLRPVHLVGEPDDHATRPDRKNNDP